jgi:hypothetical protein
MIRFLLNQIKVKYGTYTQEGNKIRRTFSNGYSYIATVCESPEQASFFVSELQRLNK